MANSLANIDAYTKAETDQLIADLIDGAPDALNTLNELAAALNDNDSDIAALLAAIIKKKGIFTASFLTF